MQERLESVFVALKDEAASMYSAREAGLTYCRKIIQLSSKSIRNVHRHDYESARALLVEARQAAEQARAFLQPHPELYFAGYLHDAEKEYVEAAAVLAMATGQSVPTPSELGAQPMSYLNGLGEAASEMRRYVLDEMRAGRLGEAERLLHEMEFIYDELIAFDFPDAMTGGLRRTCDALRAVIERTRSDLTLTQSQSALIHELQQFRSE